jgi:hypothetical protein
MVKPSLHVCFLAFHSCVIRRRHVHAMVSEVENNKSQMASKVQSVLYEDDTVVRKRGRLVQRDDVRTLARIENCSWKGFTFLATVVLRMYLQSCVEPVALRRISHRTGCTIRISVDENRLFG